MWIAWLGTEGKSLIYLYQSTRMLSGWRDGRSGTGDGRRGRRPAACRAAHGPCRRKSRIRQVRKFLTGVGVGVVRCARDEVPEVNEATGLHALDGGWHAYVGLFGMEGVIWPSQCVLEMGARYSVRTDASWRIEGCWERLSWAIGIGFLRVRRATEGAVEVAK